MADSTCTYDANCEVKENKFKRPGYVFTAWYDAKSGGTKYEGKVKLKSNLTLYARWTACGKGTYEKNGTCEPCPQGTYNNKTAQTSCTSCGPGYTTNKTGSQSPNDCKAIKYTVVFNANGGTGTMNDQSFTYGTEKALRTNNFTRSGYKFVSWNTKADGTGDIYKETYSASKITTVDGKKVTLYAQWKISSITVTLDANGGYFGSNKENTTKTKKYKLGDSYGTLPTPKRDSAKTVPDGGSYVIHGDNGDVMVIEDKMCTSYYSFLGWFTGSKDETCDWKWYYTKYKTEIFDPLNAQIQQQLDALNSGGGNVGEHWEVFAMGGSTYSSNSTTALRNYWLTAKGDNGGGLLDTSKICSKKNVKPNSEYKDASVTTLYAAWYEDKRCPSSGGGGGGGGDDSQGTTGGCFQSGEDCIMTHVLSCHPTYTCY
jgi:uncharacterized repeat protein (TIGR02543 family)